MSKDKFFTPKSVIIILIILILLGFFANILIACIEKLVYPEDYYELVMEYSEKHSVPPALVFAIIKVESNFDKDAESRVGAMGLMQMMPSTYDFLASRLNEPSINSLLYVPEVSIKYGTYYLQYLYNRFGDWEKVLVAYNWGEGNFKKYMDEHGYDDGDYHDIPVTETRNYVKKVLHHWKKYEEIYDNI